MNNPDNWTGEPGTLNKLSVDGKLRATYLRTVANGFAAYAVHPIDTPKGKRTIASALFVGGLPKL